MIPLNQAKQLVRNIINNQKLIIGPLAFEQANKVSGLKISDNEKINVEIVTNNTNELLTSLVKKYEELFGRASIEVCKDAVRETNPPLSQEDLPEILK